MNKASLLHERAGFIEQLHHEFLYLKGYGTYTYITPKDASNLFDSYLIHENNISSAITQQQAQICFIRGFIKSL
ncbi:hypothetical protein [Methylomonas sp. AM2-LC]|uniref:hypothetical protein n=1 Tax=Methylomonas sp. AM2-LC TaxID=3153301 RepID=UPI003266686D